MGRCYNLHDFIDSSLVLRFIGGIIQQARHVFVYELHGGFAASDVCCQDQDVCVVVLISLQTGFIYALNTRSLSSKKTIVGKVTFLVMPAR